MLKPVPDRSLSPPAKILIVEDHELVRVGLQQLIELQPDLQICGQASGVKEAQQLIQQTSPHIVIVDLRLEGSSGLELIQWIAERRSHTKIIVLSMHEEQDYGERVLRLGAMGYVNKQEAAQLIIAAIRRVLAAKLYFSEELVDRVLRRMASRSNDVVGSPVAALSDRELEIVTLLGHGFTTEDIANRLFLSRNTIGTYRERLKSKLRLRNAAELTRFAVCWVEGSIQHVAQAADEQSEL